jgi:hypothetical protein
MDYKQIIAFMQLGRPKFLVSSIILQLMGAFFAKVTVKWDMFAVGQRSLF